MPNGDVIKVNPGDYQCKEIPIKLSYNLGKETASFTLVELALYMYLFKEYYDCGKKEMLEWRTERTNAYNKSPRDFFSEVSTGKFSTDKHVNDLKTAYEKYKKKNYKLFLLEYENPSSHLCI